MALVLLLAALALGGRAFLHENPQHNPWAPLDLRDPRGWATPSKLAGLRGDIDGCRAVLERSEVAFTAQDATGSDECRRDDRLTLAAMPLAPTDPQMTCPVAAGMVLWVEHDLQPLAEQALGSRIDRIEHLGTFSCRRMYGGDDGPWSEHATGNAIDIAAFVLADGRRITVLDDWNGEGEAGQFLHAVRDAACASFGTVLSPDYNAAHRDHLHFDQGRSPVMGACR